MQDAGCKPCRYLSIDGQADRQGAVESDQRPTSGASLSLSALRFAAPPFLPMEAMDAWNARRATMQSIIIIMVLLLLLLLEGASL
jgi:hypothetical protein